MKFVVLQVGSYGVNCTLATDGESAWAVDPGAEAERIVEAARSEGVRVAGILLTHAHFDHIGAIPALKQICGDIPVYVHPADTPMFGHPFNMLPPEYPSVPKPSNILPACDFPFAEAIETPGHTPGGVSWYFKDDGVLLSGDTLFAGSVGRTDFPGGSMTRLVDSLSRLVALPPETKVIPGHGPSTTIGREKSSNPYIVA
ncbi:MAG: MBL fold metallo-hydrolase [Kiritimatiellae bacterium]|nr:MBL fold metallo-hydrolase [Kiritimatiellia bacterium]